MSDSRIEFAKSLGVSSRRHDAGGIHKLAKASALTQQHERDLRIAEFAYGLEKLARFVHSAASMLLAELFASDRSFQ